MTRYRFKITLTCQSQSPAVCTKEMLASTVMHVGETVRVKFGHNQHISADITDIIHEVPCTDYSVVQLEDICFDGDPQGFEQMQQLMLSHDWEIKLKRRMIGQT